MKTVIGIIGAGAVAVLHAQAINNIPTASLGGVWSRNVENAMSFAEKYNCKVYKTPECMAEDTSIEMVCICSPSGLHKESALLMAERGKHLIIEKPLEITLERCDAIIGAARKNSVGLTCIFQTRFHPAFQKLKEAVSEGRFGKISLASAYVKWFRDQKYYDSSEWRGTWKLDGGGALMNQSIHAIDLLLWLMGPVSEVKAFADTLTHKNIEVEDTLTGILRFENGALGTIEATTGAWPGSFKKIEICGSKGHAIVEEDQITTWEFDEPEVEPVESGASTGSAPAGGVNDPVDIGFRAHQKQIEESLTAFKENRSPLVTSEEARMAVELILKLYKSAGLR